MQVQLDYLLKFQLLVASNTLRNVAREIIIAENSTEETTKICFSRPHKGR